MAALGRLPSTGDTTMDPSLQFLGSTSDHLGGGIQPARPQVKRVRWGDITTRYIPGRRGDDSETQFTLSVESIPTPLSPVKIDDKHPDTADVLPALQEGLSKSSTTLLAAQVSAEVLQAIDNSILTPPLTSIRSSSAMIVPPPPSGAEIIMVNSTEIVNSSTLTPIELDFLQKVVPPYPHSQPNNASSDQPTPPVPYLAAVHPPPFQPAEDVQGDMLSSCSDSSDSTPSQTEQEEEKETSCSNDEVLLAQRSGAVSDTTSTLRDGSTSKTSDPTVSTFDSTELLQQNVSINDLPANGSNAVPLAANQNEAGQKPFSSTTHVSTASASLVLCAPDPVAQEDDEDDALDAKRSRMETQNSQPVIPSNSQNQVLSDAVASQAQEEEVPMNGGVSVHFSTQHDDNQTPLGACVETPQKPSPVGQHNAAEQEVVTPEPKPKNTEEVEVQQLQQSPRVIRRQANVNPGLESAEENQIMCAFCGREGPTYVDPDDATLAAHPQCALYASEVHCDPYQGRLVNLPDAVKRVSQLKCSHCRHHGPTAGCIIEGCQHCYHYDCAEAAGCQLVPYDGVICPYHLKQREKKSRSRSKAGSEQAASPAGKKRKRKAPK